MKPAFVYPDHWETDPRLCRIREAYGEGEADNPDVVIVLGGDGTMLRAIHRFQGDDEDRARPQYYYGLGLGTLNFMLNELSDDPIFMIQRLLEGAVDPHLFNTRLMTVSRVREGEPNERLGIAVNEVVLGKDIMGYHNFRLNSDDQSFVGYNIKGMGICVATPLGSTGFSRNNGSDIIPTLDLPLWSLTSVVAERERRFNRLIDLQTLDIEMVDSRSPCNVMVDGNQVVEPLEVGDIIRIQPGPAINLAFNDKADFRLKRIRRDYKETK